jgi:chromosome segregation ATPase
MQGIKDWNAEIIRLQNEKQTEETNKRLELVANEAKELKEIETEFQTAGAELTQCKQTLTEVSNRNSPLLAELTLKFNELKLEIRELDIDLALQDFSRLNARSDFVNQQIKVKELEIHKDENELAFAEFMAATEKLKDLERARENETEKLKEASAKLHALRVIPEYSILDRRIRELRTESLDAQGRVVEVELNRQRLNNRMSVLRAVIAKAGAD